MHPEPSIKTLEFRNEHFNGPDPHPVCQILTQLSASGCGSKFTGSLSRDAPSLPLPISMSCKCEKTFSAWLLSLGEQKVSDFKCRQVNGG